MEMTGAALLQDAIERPDATYYPGAGWSSAMDEGAGSGKPWPADHL